MSTAAVTQHTERASQAARLTANALRAALAEADAVSALLLLPMVTSAVALQQQADALVSAMKEQA